ncbi:MAG: hypothetical protein HND56_10755 [Pseudomonadota bacterium]|nr:hypothetical protein [Pseudomonadota bacterium]QKK06135.1 MAG: hypothetical protein HND56_10755 [Pseudomonadota bacterium]
MSDDSTVKNTDKTVTEPVTAPQDAAENTVGKESGGRRFWKGFNKTTKNILLGTLAVIGVAALVVVAPKVLLIGARLLLPLLVLGAAATGVVTIGRALFSNKNKPAQDVKIDDSRIQSTRSAPDQSPKPSVSPKNGFNAGAQNDAEQTVTTAENNNEKQPAARKTVQNKLQK